MTYSEELKKFYTENFGNYHDDLISFDEMVRYDISDHNYQSVRNTNDFNGFVPSRFDSQLDVKAKLSKISTILYGEKHRIKSIEQHINCTTEPYKVVCENKGAENIFYVKKPSLERVFGKTLNNLLRPEQKIQYIFNEDSFICNQVPGKEFEEKNKFFYGSHLPFLEELIRTHVFTNLIMLDDIMSTSNNSNCSYDKESKKIQLFDFHGAFREGIYSGFDGIGSIRDKGVDVKEIAQEESFRLYVNLSTNHNLIKKLLDIIHLDLPKYEFSYRLGFDNLGELLGRKFDKLIKSQEKKMPISIPGRSSKSPYFFD